MARLRSLFFASLLCATIVAQSPEKSIIRPGQAWFDTDGNRIYAGGANIYTENGVYYLVGEGKKVLSGEFAIQDVHGYGRHSSGCREFFFFFFPVLFRFVTKPFSLSLSLSDDEIKFNL